MARTLELACQVARSDVPVLITGPNGAGKERIAAIMHANSAVKRGPFVAVNCGALPGELIEAELFGAEAGAYTGANKAREGRFELADGGTLFLDEIGNLPLPGQMKLLRVLETGQFERLGSGRTRQVKVRVLSATNADLTAMIQAGTFREDLYYRLNVIEVNLPPLAERTDDILPLAEYFLDGRAELGDAAREALLGYAWPGNVRELKNAIERAALLSGGQPITPGAAQSAAARRRVRRAIWTSPAARAVEAALSKADGVVSRAAQELGLSRQALYRRMDRYGLAAIDVSAGDWPAVGAPDGVERQASVLERGRDVMRTIGETAGFLLRCACASLVAGRAGADRPPADHRQAAISWGPNRRLPPARTSYRRQARCPESDKADQQPVQVQGSPASPTRRPATAECRRTRRR